MFRPFLIELLLFVAPFAAYVLLLWAKNHDIFHPESWPLRTLTLLTVVSLVLLGVSLFLTTQYSGSRPGSTYVPAHVEGGRLVPGTTQ